MMLPREENTGAKRPRRLPGTDSWKLLSGTLWNGSGQERYLSMLVVSLSDFSFITVKREQRWMNGSLKMTKMGKWTM